MPSIIGTYYYDTRFSLFLSFAVVLETRVSFPLRAFSSCFVKALVVNNLSTLWVPLDIGNGMERKWKELKGKGKQSKAKESPGLI
jgi:hypothetical protein